MVKPAPDPSLPNVVKPAPDPSLPNVVEPAPSLPNVVEPAPDPSLPNVVEPAPSLPNVVEPLETPSNSSASPAIADIMGFCKDVFGTLSCISGDEMAAVLEAAKLKSLTPEECIEFAEVKSLLPEILSNSNSAAANALKKQCHELAHIADLAVNGLVNKTKPLSLLDILELATLAGMLN
jgi:hypothetical protein